MSRSEIHKAIERCITPLFQEGRVPPTTGRRTVRILVPESFTGWPAYRDELVELAGRTFNVPAQRVSRGREDEERIVIIVENLFRAGEEIYGIYDYYDAYSRRPRRDLHHVDRRWLDRLEPLITRTRTQTRVPCGNDGCDADLRDVSRSELFCPVCSRPIRNRCGNSGCLVDDLSTRSNLDEIITSKVCPGSDCRRKLRTYWWQCSLHGDIPIDKTSCPTCVAENIPPHATFWRPDYRDRFVCQFCVSSGKPHPHFVVGVGAQWLRFGVNGHEVQPALRYFRERLPDGNHCPTCGTILVPYCPYGSRSNGHKHFLYRDSHRGRRGRYRCYLHIAEEFHTCGSCEFPLRVGESRCSRCQTTLRPCRFCTPLFGLLIPVDTVAGRCPNCHARPDEPTAITAIEPEPPNDLFCSNIFGCPIGARMSEATLPRGTGSCPICASETLPLIEVQTRGDHVRACAFCSQLFPAVTGSEPLVDAAWRDTNRVCCLCGQTAAGARELAASPREVSVSLALAHALLRHADDVAVFTQYYADLPVADRSRIPELLAAFSQRIENPKVAGVARARLERLATHWQRQFGCRRDTSPGTKSDAAPQPGPPGDSGQIDDMNGHPIPPGLLNVSFLLAHENDIAGWIRAAKRSGLVLERLKNLQDALEAQTDPVTARRVASLIARAAAMWDSIDEL